MRNLSIVKKLLGVMLCVGAVPAVVLALLSLSKSSTALADAEYHKLQSMHDIKADQVARYFEERRGDMGVLVDTVATLRRDALEKLSAQREIKRGQVEKYFAERQGDMGVLVETVSTLREEAFAKLRAQRQIKHGQIQSYFDERQEDLDVLVETVRTCRSEAFEKLTAVREIKRTAVERYFASIRNQIVTFSEDPSVVTALKDFRSSFGEVGGENTHSAEDIARMRKELATYYNGQFAPKYRAENGGKSPDVSRILDPLDDEAVILQYHYVQANTHPLGEKHRLDRAPDASTYSKVHARVHPVIRSFLEKFGYYDIFLADPETGDIVYSVFKELDYSTSLIDGPYAKTNFGEAFRRANAAGNRNAVILVDYASYGPSYEAPASFIASPVFDGDEKIGVALFQMPIDRLNQIMTERAGLGRTGETYLIGPDKLMRSDSYLDPKNHTVRASFQDPAKGGVDTAAGKAALAGEAGTRVIIDYNGNPVLSAYCPVDIGGITWGLLSEIDVAEAFCPQAKGAREDFFTHFKEKSGYDDLYLVNPDGFCFYTVTKGADHQTNLVDGEHKDTGLGGLVRQVLTTKKPGFADFAPYAPGGGTPAAFLAAPVLAESGEVEVVVALRLASGGLNEMMSLREGLGKTGETYLVGPDRLMRSDSFLDAANRSVRASFADPDKGRVETEASRAALDGETDTRIIVDDNGNPVLSAFMPVDVLGVRWALLAEIDVAEAFCPEDDKGVAFFAKYKEIYGYYDLFLINPDGYCFYTVCREADYRTNLVDGRYSTSNLGKLVRRVLESKSLGFADFEPYEPSAGDPAAFLAQPVVGSSGKVEVVVALQLPLDRVNAIMSEREGLGETGETYLVGPDKLMRSDSYLDPKAHSVKASFADPAKGKADTAAVREALSGEKGAGVIIDYNGNPVLSAYCPIDVLGVRWALLAEIDVAEAFCPAEDRSDPETYYFRRYQKAYGYYDVFLVNPDGYAFFTAEREADYQTNLLTGAYRSSNLGKLVRSVLASGKLGFADFEPYAPSNGAPAAFLAQPVMHDGKAELVVAVQLSIDSISEMMAQGSNKDETLEAYLVGPEGLMRSDSISNPGSYSVMASFHQGNRVETDAVGAALDGQQGTEIVEDYNGQPVLSAYGPIDVYGNRWALLCEIDEARAFQAVGEMRAGMLVVLLIVVGLISAFALFLARAIANPIRRTADMLEDIAQGEGDLTKRIDVSSKDEVGQLGTHFNAFTDKLRGIVRDVSDDAQCVASSSEELSTASSSMSQTAQDLRDQSNTVAAGTEELSVSMTSMSSAAEEMSTSVNTVATAVEEMSSSLSEVAKNCAKASVIASDADGQARTTSDTMSRLNASASEIGKVLDTISDIADQTNLLALNATIEAASAGEAGKGFAVVANEVKELAKQTAVATEEISRQIEEMQGNTDSAVKAIQAITGVISEVNTITQTISSAVEEQSATTNEIARSVGGASQAANDITRSLEEASQGANQVSETVQTVDGASQQTASGAAQISSGADELAQAAARLQALMGQFKT